MKLTQTVENNYVLEMNEWEWRLLVAIARKYAAQVRLARKYAAFPEVSALAIAKLIVAMEEDPPF